MRELYELLARISAWTWPALINHLWQAAVITSLVYGLTILLRRGPARARYALWLVAAAKLAVPSALFAFLFAWLGVEAAWRGVAGATRDTALVAQLAEPTQPPTRALSCFGVGLGRRVMRGVRRLLSPERLRWV